MNHIQASVDDSTLYNEMFDDSLISKIKYCISDGEFRGCEKIICYYPKIVHYHPVKEEHFYQMEKKKLNL